MKSIALGFLVLSLYLPGVGAPSAGAQEEPQEQTVESGEEVKESSGEKGEKNEKEEKPAQSASIEADPPACEACGGEENGEARIQTGNASSTGEISTTGNANTTTSEATEAASELPLCQEKQKSHGKATKGTKEDPFDEAQGEEGEQYCREEVEMEVDNENDIVVENDAAIEADTGANTANDNSGNVEIDTGDAAAIADVFNLANTNIVESSGLFVLLSSLKEHFVDIDLREWAEYFEGDDPVCSKTTCITFSELEALNRNNATILNDIVVRAQTGENEASNNAADAGIGTGDAYAAANVVNIANTNIVNSNYLLFIANNFGSFFGDIVFPTASSFFTSLFSGSTLPYDITEIENRNTASIANNATTTAQTGANEADGNKSSVVQTGDAHSTVNIFNQVNSNLVGGNSFVALVRVSGDWSGDVFGLPEGISWRRDAGGIMLYSDDMALSFASAAEEQDSEQEEETSGEGKSSKAEKSAKAKKTDEHAATLDVNNQNTASITNNVEVLALTGKNKAKGNGGQGTIQTGDARAIANIVNIANTNVIGKNWLFAIFNILGNFEGNISFGRPDLWIGQRAEIPNDPVLPGDAITYYLTVVNNGDAPATQVTVSSIFPLAFLDFGVSDDFAKVQGDTISWGIASLHPGESRELAFTVVLRGDIPFGLSTFSNNSSATAKESEENEADNTDTVELVAFREEPAPPEERGSGGARGPQSSAPRGTAAGAANSSDAKAPNLQVAKTHEVQGSIRAGDSVDYTIVITNTNGGAAQEAVLVDTLKTEAGELVHEEVWDLGRIFPDEEITITYTTVFAHATGPGVYRNNARVEALGAASNVASTAITVEESPYLVLAEELTAAEAQLRLLEEQLLGLELQEEQTLALGETEEAPSPVAAAAAKTLRPIGETRAENRFSASLTGLALEYGRWLSAFAAAALALLFFLLRRKVL